MSGKWFMVFGGLFLAGCSLFDDRPSSSATSAVVQRDIEYQARPSSDPNLRKRILVLPFIDEKTDRSKEVANSARQSLVFELLKSGQFVIVKNEDFPQDLGKFLTENREYDLEKIAPIAASMGVAAVIEGKIFEIKAKRIGDEVGVFRKVKARVETTVRVRTVAARNGKLILDDMRSGTVEESTTRVGEYSYSDRFLEEDPNLVRLSVTQAFRGSLGPLFKAIEKLHWEGRVAMISGERVFVNAGRLSGIQIGDILKILEEGEEVYDPETGTFIGRAPGRMKGTIEVVSYFGRDGAIAIIHSGSGFQENDRVELY